MICGILHTGDNCDLDCGDKRHGGYLIPMKYHECEVYIVDENEVYVIDDNGNCLDYEL